MVCIPVIEDFFKSCAYHFGTSLASGLVALSRPPDNDSPADHRDARGRRNFIISIISAGAILPCGGHIKFTSLAVRLVQQGGEKMQIALFQDYVDFLLIM